ncbi:T9SS type A sorting domain-containing protein [Aureispira anguillae]|uniref:Uncharacterized protein n=1 Tax=Aureispira anguillae TaxID=2864201 RepID=A0A915VK29_9BACT|nr:hypothetical protein [Aureispira anguillae]BDS09468.1 hypothetical protein AsAng_0001660 [Aureispira anguillae]
MNNQFYWVIIFSLIFLNKSKATHLMGGDLTYACLGSNQYELTLTIYRDCNGINLGTVQVIYQNDDCGATSSHYMMLVHSEEITPVCANAQASACNGGGGAYGIEKFVYQKTVTLNPSCSNVNFYWSLCCRSSAINTLGSPGSESMYIHTSIPDVSMCNSSPTFLNDPVPFVGGGQPVYYNDGAIDGDGDDLIFSLVNCKSDATNAVVYASGFSGTSPLSTVSGITIDTTTGALSFTPNQVQVGVLCILVEEYRNGLKIGEIVRDIQFTVLTSVNDNPVLTGIDSSNLFLVNLKAGTNVCFDVFSNDPNTSQSVSMRWNGAISGGIFAVDSSGQFPKGTFCWTPTINDIGHNVFTVTVFDDNCPLLGINTYTFSLFVSIDTITSVTAGNWSDAGTWDCNCIPALSQNIVVQHNVVLGTNFTVVEGAFMTVKIGDSLSILDGYELRLEGDFNNYGKVEGKLVVGGANVQLVRLGELDQVEIDNPTNVLVADNCIINEKIVLSSGNFNSNGYDVVLKSDSNGSALVEDNGGLFVGPLVVQRYLFNTIGHHFISSPFSDATINELADDFSLMLNTTYPRIYYYDETNTSNDLFDGWLSPTSLTHMMGQGEGFSCYFMAGSGITLDMKGTINTGPIHVLLKTSPSSSTVDESFCPPEGWNLVGNPYPSPLNFDLLMQATSGAVEKAFYIWDPVSKTYLSYVNGIGSPSDLGAIIPSMQGFWVKANSNTFLSFDNSMRVTNPNDTSNTFLKSVNANNPIFRLEMDGQGRNTEIVACFRANTTTGFDSNFDAFFIPSGYSNSIDFAFATEDGPLRISSIPPAQSFPVTIPLQSKVTNTGTYTISMTEFTNFSSNDQLILEDVALGVSHVLNNGPYTFIAAPNDSLYRFILRVGPPTFNALNSIKNSSELNVYKCNNALCLSFEETNTTTTGLSIYNHLGQLMQTLALGVGQKEYRLDQVNLPSPNLYFVRLESTNEQITKAITW